MPDKTVAKLGAHLATSVNTESSVVYLLSLVRKLTERDGAPHLIPISVSPAVWIENGFEVGRHFWFSAGVAVGAGHSGSFQWHAVGTLETIASG